MGFDFRGIAVKQILLIVVAVALAVRSASCSEPHSAADDLAKLRGTWLTVSLVSGGKTLVDERTPAAQRPATKLVYAGNNWMLKVGPKTVASGTFQIDASKSPKLIDIVDPSGQKKLGIYELNGDVYKYCLAPAGQPRPTAFQSNQGSQNSVGVSKREKP